MSNQSSDRRPRLRDIVRGNLDDLQQAFDESVRTGGRTLIPAGRYRCLIVSGSIEQAKTGTPSFKLVFEVVEGEHTGRKVFYDIWLTVPALRMSGHELKSLGFRSIPELEERPLRSGLLADVAVVINTDDDDSQRNKVKSFKVVKSGVPADDFRPDDDLDDEEGEGDDEHLDDDGFDWRNGIQHVRSAPLLDASPNGKGTT